MAAAILRRTERVYAVGHPDQSRPLNLHGVVNVVTDDNAQILRSLSRCRAVVSHNSGAVFIPLLLRIPAIVVHPHAPERFEWTCTVAKPFLSSPLERAVDTKSLEALIESYPLLNATPNSSHEVAG